MMKRVFGHPVLIIIISAVLISGALACLFTPDLPLFKLGANFTVQIMLGYLLLGMALFILNQRTLMYTSLGCCAALCIYLKSAANENLMLPQPTEAPKLTCALINLSLSGDFENTTDVIHQLPADIILFQEYTPDWNEFLTEDLLEEYPYRATMTRIDPFGMAWFSRHPIMLTDTFSAAEIPNLLVNVQLPDGLLVNMVSMHTRVPGNAAAYKNIRRHFHEAAEYMQSLEDPVIVAGDLNLPSWVNEVREFKLQGQLKDSRRDILPASMQGTVNLLKVPVDHILFTADMECTAFHEILDAKDGHLGIVGTYEYVEKE